MTKTLDSTFLKDKTCITMDEDNKFTVNEDITLTEPIVIDGFSLEITGSKDNVIIYSEVSNAFYVKNGGTLKLKNIILKGTEKENVITDSIFKFITGKISSNVNGLIEIKDGRLNIEDCRIEGAFRYPIGIDSSEVEILRTQITDNTNGGINIDNQSRVSIHESIIKGNGSQLEQTAQIISNASALHITDSQIDESNGGVAIEVAGGETVIERTLFTDTAGKAILKRSDATITIKDCGDNCQISEEKKGKGFIKCETCDGEGTVKCTKCDGKGSTTCGYCEGKGCSRCNDGIRKCKWCDATGRKKCYDCDGDGKIVCESCDGDGSIYCVECDGEGEFECELCKGEGTVGCEECDGQGTITCDRCDGEGEIDCVHCDGNGCKNCDNGKKECKKCGGDGTLTCPECDGEGEIDCEDCDGQGTQKCAECDGKCILPCEECR